MDFEIYLTKKYIILLNTDLIKMIESLNTRADRPSAKFSYNYDAFPQFRNSIEDIWIINNQKTRKRATFIYITQGVSW